jgi:preprotein translocase subunit Sec63
MVDITQGLYFAQNLFDIVGRQQSDLFDGVESLFQFMSRLDDLAVTSFALLEVSTSFRQANAAYQKLNLLEVILVPRLDGSRLHRACLIVVLCQALGRDR